MFLVDDASYSCAEQCMMAENARLFHDHRALGFILCSSDPQLHKRTGRNVCGFDHAIWERERENSVVADGLLPIFSKTRL